MSEVVVTQLVVDASGAHTGVDQYVADMARAKQASEDAGKATAGGPDSFEAAQRKWIASLAAADPVLRAQLNMQKALENQQRISTRAVELGITTQRAAEDQLERVRRKYQQYMDAATQAANGQTLMARGAGVLGEVIAGIGISVGIAEIAAWSKEIVVATGGLVDQSKQLQQTTDSLQAYREAFRQGGSDIQDADRAMAAVNKTAGEAADNIGEGRRQLAEWNVNWRDMAAARPEDRLALIAKGLLGIEDGGRRALAEQTLFGRSGREIESVLEDLAGGVDRLKEKFKDEIVPAGRAAEAKEALDAISKAMRDMEVTASGPIIAVINLITSLIDKINQLQKLRDTFTWGDLGRGLTGQGWVATGMNPDALQKGQNNFGSPSHSYTPPAGAAAVDTNFTAYLTGLKQEADMANMSAQKRAESTALIAAANAYLKDGLVYQGEAADWTGKQAMSLADVAKILPPQLQAEVRRAAALEASGKAADKLRLTFSGYLGELQESARVAGESVAQREAESAIIRGAQVMQKQNNVEQRNLVQNYSDALSILNAQQVAQIRAAAAAGQTAAFQHDLTSELIVSRDVLAAGTDNRELAAQIAQKQLDLGRALTGEEKAQLELIQARNDQARLDDNLRTLRDDVTLAGLAADEREREAAVLDAMHATHGRLRDDQAAEIRGLVNARQETERWQSVTDGLTNGFQSFFQDFFSTFSLNFGKLWDNIRQQFAALLAWMATQALLRPIIIPMVESFAGQLGGATSALGMGTLGGAGSLATLLGGSGASASGAGVAGLSGIIGNLSDGVSSGINWLGTNLGFGTQLPGVAGGTVNGISLAGINPTNVSGSIFGSTTLGGALGMFGAGSMIGGMLGGNSLVSGALGLGGSLAGGALLGTTLGAAAGPVGMLAGALLGAALGDFGASNKSSTANFTGGGTGFSLGQLGDQATQGLTTQAATQISTILKGLSDAGIDYSNPLSGVNIGHDKSYLYYTSGQKQKLGKADDVPTVVSAALDVILKSVHTTDANLQTVLDHYMQSGGITADNINQVVSDLGFAKTLANFDFGTTKLTQTEQTLKSITDQFDQAIQKAQDLGLDTSALVNQEQDALQSVTDDFNDSVTDALNAVIDGPLQQWNALVKAQDQQMAEAKAASADLANVEQLQYLQRKQLLMSLDDAQRESLTNLIGLADDLATKTVTLQATALEAINSQIDAAKQFQQQQQQIANSFLQASQALGQARTAFLVDPNTNRLSPMAAYQQSGQLFDTTANSALGGNLDALNQLSSLAQSFLNNSLQVNATGSAYFADFQHVQDILAQAQAVADKQQTDAQKLASLAQAQEDTLQDIVTELQKPDPNTDLIRDSVARLDALGLAMGQNADAVVSQLSGSTAATIDQLGQTLVAAGIAQTGKISGDLDILRAATADGLVTVAEAGPVRDALADLKGAIGAQLSNQDSLSQSQLSAALEAQASLDSLSGQIGTGINVLNLAGVISPLNQLVQLTQQTAAAQDAAKYASGLQDTFNAARASADSLRQQRDAVLAQLGPQGDTYVQDDYATGQIGGYMNYYTYTPDAQGTALVTQAKSLNSQYIDAFNAALAAYRAIPGHASGLDYVPYDNYVARLHQGERVQTAAEAANFRAGRGANDNSAALLAEMKAMRQEIARLRAAADKTAANTGTTAANTGKTVDSVGQLNATAKRGQSRELFRNVR